MTISVIYFEKSTHFGDLRNFCQVYTLKNVRSQDFDRRRVDGHVRRPAPARRDPTKHATRTCALALPSYLDSCLPV